jgi:hypothetical protein
MRSFDLCVLVPIPEKKTCDESTRIVIGSNQAMQQTRPAPVTSSQHIYEVRPRKDKRGVDLISDAPPFGRLWYGEPDAIANAIGYAKFARRL